MNENFNEVILTSGRSTKNVTRKGYVIYRSCCPNSSFVHCVLQWMEAKQIAIVPLFLGFSDDGREMISFLEGTSPPDLGDFNESQLIEASKIIRLLHDVMSDFPGCGPDQTICHNDLSPCNFMFMNELPYAVFDWDAAGIGNPLDDVAYAVWMWCNIGDVLEDGDLADLSRKIRIILEAYGLERKQWYFLPTYIYRQMQRVAKSLKAANNFDGQQWAEECERQLKVYENKIMNIVLEQ